MSDQEYVTYNQAAEMLDISRTTVERLIRDGALRTRKMPRSFPSVSAASVREVAEMLRAQNAETSSQRETARRARAEAAERRGPPPGDDVWLDSLTVAAILGVSRARVSELGRKGRLPRTVRADRVWFRRTDVEVFVAARAFKQLQNEARRRSSEDRATA